MVLRVDWAPLTRGLVASASPLVTYDRSGGIAGQANTLTVKRDRHATRVSNRSGSKRFRLSKKRYAALRNALRGAKFSTLKPSYGPPPNTVISDGITEVVAFRGHTVKVMTGGEPPDRLERALDKLRNLAPGI